MKVGNSGLGFVGAITRIAQCTRALGMAGEVASLESRVTRRLEACA
jgi:hypothetical protein